MVLVCFLVSPPLLPILLAARITSSALFLAPNAPDFPRPNIIPFWTPLPTIFIGAPATNPANPPKAPNHLANGSSLSINSPTPGANQSASPNDAESTKLHVRAPRAFISVSSVGSLYPAVGVYQSGVWSLCWAFFHKLLSKVGPATGLMEVGDDTPLDVFTLSSFLNLSVNWLLSTVPPLDIWIRSQDN